MPKSILFWGFRGFSDFKEITIFSKYAIFGRISVNQVLIFRRFCKARILCQLWKIVGIILWVSNYLSIFSRILIFLLFLFTNANRTNPIFYRQYLSNISISAIDFRTIINKKIILIIFSFGSNRVFVMWPFW